jgi:hypothetical protein
MADEQEQQALIPVEQDTVTFYGWPLVAVRLTDGRICVVLRWLCESLQLNIQAQLRRIRRTKAIAEELAPVRVMTDGGPQVMPALTLRALPFWLAGIDTSRVAADLESVILTYQREVVDVLYHHFAQRRPALQQSATLVPTEPITRPEAPSLEAPPAEWLRYHEQMVIWLRWQADLEQWRAGMETWRGQMESRLESVEEVSRLVPEILERLGPQTLSPEHQRTVQHAVHRLHELTGQAYGTIYDQLKNAFAVPKYADIPEDRWPEVAHWFSARMDEARRRPGQR